jgi:septal ring-binding cell division protein DamX
MAQAAGQILLLNVSVDTVKEIVGPGAVWPTLTKGDVAKNVILDIEAGSSGRPNQAQELQNFERLAPILMQIPGITPMFLAQQALTRLDDSIDLDGAIADGQPSVLAQNGVQPGASTGLGPGAGNPAAQGPRGQSNAPGAPSPQSSAPTPMNAAPPGPPSQGRMN